MVCKHFGHYLTGLEKFKQITGHKPLLLLINTKDIGNTPVRCQRLLLRLIKFNVVAKHCQGTMMYFADALSQNLLPFEKARTNIVEKKLKHTLCWSKHTGQLLAETGTNTSGYDERCWDPKSVALYASWMT